MAVQYRYKMETFHQPETETCNHTTWFQQDGTTSHTAEISREKLHWFGVLHWQLISADLSANCFLWQCLKCYVYQIQLTTLDELSARVQEQVLAVPQEMSIMCDGGFHWVLPTVQHYKGATYCMLP